MLTVRRRCAASMAMLVGASAIGSCAVWPSVPEWWATSCAKRDGPFRHRFFVFGLVLFFCHGPMQFEFSGFGTVPDNLAREINDNRPRRVGRHTNLECIMAEVVVVNQQTVKQVRQRLGKGVTAAEYIQKVLEKFGPGAMQFLPEVLAEAHEIDDVSLEIDDVLLEAAYQVPLADAKAAFAELGRESFVIQSALDHCAETVPSALCEEFGLPAGTTYADAVHEIRVRAARESGVNHYITVAGSRLDDPHVSPAMRKAMEESQWFIARRKYSENLGDPTLEDMRQKRITPKALARILKRAWCVRQIRFFPVRAEGICIESGRDGYYLAVPEEEMQRALLSKEPVAKQPVTVN